MPPATNSLRKAEHSTDDRLVLASFFGSDGVANAIRASEFDVAEETTLLINGMRDPDPKIALKAQSQFRSLVKQVAEAQGILVHTTQRGQLPDGTQGSISTSQVTGSSITARLASSPSCDIGTSYAAKSLPPSTHSDSSQRIATDADYPAGSPVDHLGEAQGG